MATLNWKTLAGQERIKEVLGTAYANGTLGHAYLLAGDAGTGPFAAALELSMALLCKSEGSGKPCHECESCKKVKHYAHPDFHVVMPMSLSAEHKASDGKLSTVGWQHLSNSVSERLANVYYPREHAGLPTIPVEWVREINHAILRGSLDGGTNVSIIDGVDIMSREAANAMLKTLEEPPAGTIMLLLTDRLHAVLPTIVSRCQILRFATLPPDLIRGEMARMLSLDPGDERLDQLAYTGSLGASLYLYDHPATEVTQDAAELWDACLKKDWPRVTASIDRLSEINDYSTYERLFIQMMNLVRNGIFGKIADSDNYFMVDRSQSVDIGGFEDPDKIGILARRCEDALSAVKARGNISLVLANFAISCMEALHGEEQQVS